MDKLLADHVHSSTDNEGRAKDVYSLALEMYKSTLSDLQQKDVHQLKKQILDLKRVKNDLLRDLDEEETNEQSLIGQHEDMWFGADPRVTQLRKQCVYLIQQIEEVKQEFNGDKPIPRISEEQSSH
jgi:hypothetical protein